LSENVNAPNAWRDVVEVLNRANADRALLEGLSPKMGDGLSNIIRQVAREWGVSVVLSESNQRYADAVARIDRGQLL
jgi:hypothetical protein